MTAADDKTALLNAVGTLRAQARALRSTVGYIFKEISETASTTAFETRSDRESLVTNASMGLYALAASIGAINDQMLPLVAARSFEVLRGPLVEPIAALGAEIALRYANQILETQPVRKLPPGVADLEVERLKRR